MYTLTHSGLVSRKSTNEHRMVRMPRSKRLARESRASRVDVKQGEMHNKERNIGDIQVELIDDVSEKSIIAPEESEQSATPAPSLSSSQDSLFAPASQD